MDKITASQFKSWKNEEAGKVFFKWLSDNIKEEKIKLESISKNPFTCSQEDYFKKCMECGINIRNWQTIYDAKIIFIQGEEVKEDEQAKGSK